MKEEEVKEKAEAIAKVIKKDWPQPKIRRLKEIQDTWPVKGPIYMFKDEGFKVQINEIPEAWYEIFIEAIINYLN